MDTSEIYIKMCEKAEEIQKIAPILSRGDMQNCFMCCHLWHHLDNVYLEYHGYFIWLPRQDQIQEMLGNYTDNILLFWNEFAKFDGDGDIFSTPNYILFANSMEQLWLSFYMKDKHNKIWNGEKWIKSGD